MSQWLDEKKMVLETAREMAGKGLALGTSGNVSLRLPPQDGREMLAITPTSRYYDLLMPEEIPVIDFETEPVEGELPPSSESLLHIEIYRMRKNIRAVIHTHSVYASALAVACMEIPPILEDQVCMIGGTIGLAEYAPSGSDELTRNVIDALKDRNAVLLKNHGMVGAGRDLREALLVCELVEKTSRAYYLCLTLGRVNLLTEEGISAGRAYFKMAHG
ncbi:MAG: class II aldolase/adducin family protein [Dehalococcoidales bacterium]|nr:class II aldolase/adducin family protein [Dehalococcoidales bacterium]